MHKIIASLVISSSFIGCATTTEIVTAQPGASVIRESDNKELGVTPYKLTTSMWLWESEKLRIVPRRGAEKSIEIKRSEVDLLPLGGGICLGLTGIGCVAGVPLILAGGFKLPEKTEVKLEDGPTSARASLAEPETPATETKTKATTTTKKKKPATTTRY